MIEHLTQPSPAELDALTALWEASVRATHDFLSEEDIPFFRQMVRNEALAAVDLYVIRDTDDRTDRACGSGGTDGADGADGNRGSTAASPTGETGRDSRANEFGGFTAFAGVAGDMLEMLFVAPGARGKGFGRQLVNHVTRHCGVRRVDVNEQNPQAAGFYERMGFRTAGRDATDPSGRPYPILHMELGHAPHTGLVKIPSLPTDRIGIGIGFRAEVPGTDTEKQP